MLDPAGARGGAGLSLQRGLILSLQLKKKRKDSSRSFSKQGSGVKTRQTGRSCPAWRDDPLLFCWLHSCLWSLDSKEFHGDAEGSFPALLLFGSLNLCHLGGPDIISRKVTLVVLPAGILQQ